MMIGSGAPRAFELPAALSDRGFALRRETEGDLAFLARLYASTREQELAAVPWSAEETSSFLLQQFDAQRRHYYAHFRDCAFDVIECAGEPLGRLYLDPRERRFHIVDIALLPEWRGRGIGTRILETLIETAERDRRGVGIFVEKFNRALALYLRLGFVQLADHGVYLEMERPPA